MDTDGLSITCAGLGSIEEDDEGNQIGYTRDEYCLDNLKDLLRFLRRDDQQKRDVFKQVCKWNIVGKDLVPIIEYCQDDKNLVLNAVKVLVFLTMPVEVTSKDVNEQLEYLWGVKKAITFSDVIAVIVSLLEKPLENLEAQAFTEDDWKLVQLVLTLFRNLLAVQEISLHQNAAGFANQLLSLRDDFLEKLFKENIMDLIIIITQHVDGSCRYLRHDNLLLLEIYHYILVGQDPELIAKASQEDSKEDGNASTSVASLQSLMQEEAEKRKQARLHASRHSQFSGAFTRLTLDGSRAMCKGVPSSMSCDKILKPEKVHRGPSKRVVKDYTRLPTRKQSILELLQDFLNQFLTGGYNVLMQSIAVDIEKEHHAIGTSDVLMFFQLTQFVTSFQYHKSIPTQLNAGVYHESSVSDDDDSTWFKGDICGPIAATMNESMFELVIAQWRSTFDGFKESKNNAFLSAGGSLMKIMIRMLDLVLKMVPENSKEPQIARTILYKLFYDQTEQGLTQLLLNMIRMFDAHKQPKSDLADLVEIIHVFIRLMEKLQAHGTLRVAKKNRKVRRKKKDDLKDVEKKSVGDDVNDQNDAQCPGSQNESTMDSDNKENATRIIHDEQEENADVPSQIDENETSKANIHDLDTSLVPEDQRKTNEAPEDIVNGVDGSDLSEDEQLAVTNEVDFKITSLLFPLASSTIISNLCWLLKFYKSNSLSTNHYILSLLRRISDDLDLTPMLYQLSCLVIFYDILNEQKASPHKDYENIVQFLTSLVRRMLQKMKSQPLLFVDILFWKSRRDCHYLNLETIQREVGEMREEVRNWDNDGGANQSHGKQNTRNSLADALGDDEYDVVIQNETHFERDDSFEEAVEENFLKTGGDGHIIEEQFLKGNIEGATGRKKRLVSNGELEDKIRSLYEMHKDNPSCIQLIAEALDPVGNISPSQVSRKCKKLGLQLPSKNLSRSNDQTNENSSEMDGHPSSSNPESLSLRKPSHTRKRVRALDENQELKIRSLFEQFKDHKRCSHMIAKELDPEGEVTAAQVSRKLKKLGLLTSQMAMKANRLLMSKADEDDSDDQPLSTLRERNQRDVPLPPADSSEDDLVLSSVLKKTKKGHLRREEKLKGTSTLEGPAQEDSEHRTAQGSNQRDASQTNATKADSPSSSSLDEATGTTSLGEREFDKNQGADKFDSGNNVYHTSPADLLETDFAANSSEKRRLTKDDDGDRDATDVHNFNELEDSGDEQPLSASPRSFVKRRRLQVMLDFEDDE